MELRHYWGILRRAWKLLVGLPLLVAVVTLVLDVVLPPTYTITTQMLVTQQQIAATASPLTLPNYENYHSWVSSEYADDDLPQLVQTRRFTTDVANWVQSQHGITLDPDDLTTQFSAERQHRMVSLTVVDRDQKVARYLAQGAVAMLQQNGLGYWERQDSATLKVSEVDMPLQAKPEKGVLAIILDVVLRSLLALILAIGVAFILHYLDRSIQTRAQVEALGIVPAGMIPREPSGASRTPHASKDARLVTLNDPHSPAAEGYRALRTRLQFGVGEHAVRSLVVTSATAKEDRATAAANLAVTFAQAGRRVVLVDADLRRPSIHEVFGLANDIGLGDALREERQRPALQKTRIVGLSVLTAGPANEQSADLLASPRIDPVIAALTQDADIVIFNTPPVTVITDAVVLATKVDGALVVLRAEKTPQDRAREAIRLLEQVNAHVIGTVFTDAPADNLRY